LIWVQCTDLSENGFFGILAIFKNRSKKYTYPVQGDLFKQKVDIVGSWQQPPNFQFSELDAAK